jgi:acyl-CoA thioester hydrolase
LTRALDANDAERCAARRNGASAGGLPQVSRAAADPSDLDPASYHFWYENQVRFADLDLLNHVNNIAFTVYAEDARAAFLTTTGLWRADSPRHNVIARLEVDYLHELRYPARVHAGLRVLALGRSSMTLGVAIFGEQQRCVALTKAVAVRWHIHERKPIEINEEERAVLRPYMSA